MLALRSLFFNTVFYVNLALFLLLGSGFFFTPRRWSMVALKVWAESSLWWLSVLCGIRLEVRGLEHIPHGAAIVAGKHQSVFETFAILPLLDDPAMVLKKELTTIPWFGWFAHKFRMIPVARDAGPKALKALIAAAGREASAGRQILIFPEGTRRAPGAPPDYKPGAAALYGRLDLPCVPFALNSGHFWPRRKFWRYPGTIVIEFLPAIAPGLPRKRFAAALETAIETATAGLAQEVQTKNELLTR
jgi:1-acyl-sn-glycerol-3-phosphate acyltransferase